MASQQLFFTNNRELFAFIIISSADLGD